MSKVAVESEESLGKLLAQARTARKTSLDKAAHDTRIRVERLRDIENDDLAHFAHPSYARMFLVDYARYLDLPLARIKHLLPERATCGAEGYEYLSGAPCEVAARSARQIRPRRRLTPLLVGSLALLLVTLGGFELWKLKGNIERLNLSRPSADVVTRQTETTVDEPAPAPAVEAMVEPAPDQSDATISRPSASTDSHPDNRASLAVGAAATGGRVQ